MERLAADAILTLGGVERECTTQRTGIKKKPEDPRREVFEGEARGVIRFCSVAMSVKLYPVLVTRHIPDRQFAASEGCQPEIEISASP